MKNMRGTIRIEPKDITVYGTVKVGERGQVVIPSEVRKELEIRPGDFLLVVETPMKNGVAMIKAEAVQEMISRMTIGLTGWDEGKTRSPAKKRKK